MHDIYKSYADFWGQFINPITKKPIAAYPEGFAVVKEGDKTKAAPTPYITYPIRLPDAFTNNFLQASIWDRQPTHLGYAGVVADVMGQMMAKMPHAGSANLQLDGGTIRLFYQNSQIIGDPGDPAIVRGVFSFMMRSNYGNGLGGC